MMQRTANENAACERRICKRSDQPKINRITNNDADLLQILRSQAAFSFAVLCIIMSHCQIHVPWNYLGSYLATIISKKIAFQKQTLLDIFRNL